MDDPRAVSANHRQLDPRVWIIPGTIRRWIDGDTFDGDLDWGRRNHYLGPCRIAHMDTPERKQPVEWAAARDYAQWLCPVGSVWIMRSVALDKYGRPLVEIDLGDGALRGFADRMISAGHAVAYELTRQVLEA